MKKPYLSLIIIVSFSIIILLTAQEKQSEVPDLRGTWKAYVSGMVLGKDRFQSGESELRHLDIEGTLTIDKQEGFRFSGIKSSSGQTKQFIGVIGFDNISIFIVDEEGHETAQLITSNEIESYYQHSVQGRMAVCRCRYVKQEKMNDH
jgi:hypothetical protein